MGGGDLNLKKSWDPRRLDNQEKKWKREETDKSERRRMKELIEERREEKTLEEMRRQGEDAGVMEKGKDRLDWMYKGPGGHINPEDYLLGKEVDKDIMDVQSGQKQAVGPQGGVASAGAVYGSSATSTLDAKDMARKMREDPLFAIKKRELNSRKELVSNPIRMKQLQQMLQTQVGKDKKKRKKSKKQKEKRSKKHRKSRDTSSESSSEEERTSGLPKRRSHHQRVSPDKRKHGQYREGRGRKGSNDSTSESEEDEPRYGGGNPRIASLDTAKMKELLEREMTKKKRKQRETSSESSSSGSDSDERDRKRPKKHSDSRSRSRQLEGEQKQRLKSHEDRSDSHRRRKDRSASPQQLKRKADDGERTQKRYGLHRGGKSSRRSETPSPERPARNHPRPNERPSDTSPHKRRHHHGDGYPEKAHDRRKDTRSPSPQPQMDKYASRPSDGKTEKRRQRERSHSRSPAKQHSRTADRHKRSRSKSPQRPNGNPKPVTTKSRKLTAEEMERKRAEMMDNAKWRDDQRRHRVKEYEKEELAEADMEKKKSRNAEFVQPMKLPDNSSVEDRIHRNIHSIQRTKAALDKNFAKR